jgi:hypothetical protein
LKQSAGNQRIKSLDLYEIIRALGSYPPWRWQHLRYGEIPRALIYDGVCPIIFNQDLIFLFRISDDLCAAKI